MYFIIRKKIQVPFNWNIEHWEFSGSLMLSKFLSMPKVERKSVNRCQLNMKLCFFTRNSMQFDEFDMQYTYCNINNLLYILQVRCYWPP